jgi:FkbM family methyltransferase
MGMFKTALIEYIGQRRNNNFGVENFDEHRFGKFSIKNEVPKTLSYSVKQFIKRIIGYEKIQSDRHFNEIVEKSMAYIDRYENGLEYFYNNVSANSKDLIVEIIAYRMLGFSKIKLTANNNVYWEALNYVKTLKIGDESCDPNFMHIILDKFDLNSIGFNIILFFNELGVVIDFITEQYAYKVEGRKIIQANKGDIVFDIGGCWGDTALYFADKVGDEGKVYSFEFIPNNIKLHNINTELNKNLKERIHLIPNPVSNISDVPVYFKDNGPGSKIESHSFEGQTGSAATISIDDYVNRNKLTKVDFIKMDIEGAETLALEGAVETIRKFKPTLAIAIYHSMEDFINIPRWILDLNLGYELFVGHYTIHEEETICFAKSNN